MTASQTSLAAAIAAQPFRARCAPRELVDVERNPQGWLRRQLEGKPPVLEGEGLQPSSVTLSRALELRKELAAARREKQQGGEDAAKVAAALKLPALYRPAYIDETYARLSQAVNTDRPFLERLTQFWTNHFAVSVDKIVVLGIAGAMEREAIRPHVLRQLHAPAVGGRKASRHAAVPGQPGVDRAELARRAFPREARQGRRPQGGHQREPGA
jgi:uncharacterized protein (DUF1800 family)